MPLSVSKIQNLFILHSLTKFYALPGLRLGFALANPQLTCLLHKGKDPWNVNSLAQIAGWIVGLSLVIRRMRYAGCECIKNYVYSNRHDDGCFQGRQEEACLYRAQGLARKVNLSSK